MHRQGSFEASLDFPFITRFYMIQPLNSKAKRWGDISGCLSCLILGEEMKAIETRGVWYALKNLINIKKFLPFILSKSYGEKFQKFVWETKTKQTVMCPSEFTFEFQSSEAVWCFVVITALLASAAAGHTDWTSPDCDCLLTAGTLETVSTEHCTLNHKEKINTSSLVITNSG